MNHDVIVVGGSYSGMAATLQLVRARRSVLVIDAGQRRNRFASHSHGFLGQDGVPPGEIAANARRQLEAYPTLTWLEGRVEAVAGQADEFTVTTADGESHLGRRILLATGVTDQLPAIDGLAQRWGKTVFHCPYCHGYELGQGRIGIVGASPMTTAVPRRRTMHRRWLRRTHRASTADRRPGPRARPGNPPPQGAVRWPGCRRSPALPHRQGGALPS